jgi:hypothetical protein
VAGPRRPASRRRLRRQSLGVARPCRRMSRVDYAALVVCDPSPHRTGGGVYLWSASRLGVAAPLEISIYRIDSSYHGDLILVILPAQAVQENADSRVYAGIRFRTACQDGITFGPESGRNTTNTCGKSATGRECEGQPTLPSTDLFEKGVDKR